MPPVAVIEADLETRLLEYTYQIHMGEFPIHRYEGFGEFEVGELRIRDSTNSIFDPNKYRLSLVLIKKRPLGQPRPKPTYNLRLISLVPPSPTKYAQHGNKKSDINFYIWCVMGDFAERGVSRELRLNDMFFLSEAKTDAKARVIFNLKIVLPCGHPSEVNRPNKLEANVQMLKDLGTFSDCTIETNDGKTFPAHKCFLALKSPVFQTAFESSMKEANDNVLSLPCDNEVGAALLDYVYLEKLPEVTEENAVVLLGLGHVYEMSAWLKHVADGILLFLGTENVLQYVVLAERYNLETLEYISVKHMAKNIDEIMSQPGWSDFRIANHKLMDKLLKALASQIRVDE